MVFGKNSEEFIKIVGNVVIQFTFNEHTCSMITDAITSSSEGSKVFYKTKNAEKRIESFKSLTKNIKGTNSKEFQSFLDRLDKIREKRNFLAHSIYGNLFDNNDEILATTNGKIKNYSMTEHRQVLKDIEKLTRELLNFGTPLLIEHATKIANRKK